MNIRTKFILGATFLFVATASLYASNNNEDITKQIVPAHKYNSAFKQGEVIVKFKDAASVSVRRNSKGCFASSGIATFDKCIKELNVSAMEQLMPLTGSRVSSTIRKAPSGSIIKDIDLSKLFVLKFDNSTKQIEEIISDLEALDDIEYAEPNFITNTQSTDEWGTSDPMYSQQWGLTATNVPQMWSLSENKKIILDIVL